MRQLATNALFVLLCAVVSYLALEGVVSIARDEPGPSLTRRLLERRPVSPVATGPLAGYLQSRGELEERLPELRANRVVLGNSPFKDLATQETRVTQDDERVGKRYKPGLRVRSAYLRSRIFRRLDPLAYSYIERPGEPLDPGLAAFLERYAFREVVWTTDEHGFRTTLPPSASDRWVVLLGSSPCVGLFVSDEETLASALQRRQGHVRFVNACVTGTQVLEHAAMAEWVEERFAERIEGGIYTINDRNFERLGDALSAVDRIASTLERVEAGYRVLIFHHRVYVTMPDIARENRRLGEVFAHKEAILERARERGFHVVDTYDLVNDYRRERGSLVAGFALYIDQGHLSREGTRLLASRVPPAPR